LSDIIIVAHGLSGTTLFFFSFCRASESLLFVVAGECNSDVGSHVLKLCLLKKGMAITATMGEQ